MHLPKKIMGSLLALASLFGTKTSMGQKTGTLPYNGVRYFYEGITAKKIDVKIEDKDLKTNKIPLGKYVDFFINAPEGFSADAEKKYFVGAEVLYISADKKILSNSKNIFSDFETKGFSKEALANMKISVNMRPELLNNNKNVDILIRIYDLKSDKKLRLIFNADIIAAVDNQATTAVATKTTTTTTPPISASKPTAVPASTIPTTAASDKLYPEKAKPTQIKGIKISNIEVSVDHSIRVAPTMAYLSIEMMGITGTSLQEITSGNESFTVYDENNKPLVIKDKLLKKIKGSMEDSIVDYTVKIPFRAKDLTGKKYKVIFNWTNGNKSKLIEVISTK